LEKWLTGLAEFAFNLFLVGRVAQRADQEAKHVVDQHGALGQRLFFEFRPEWDEIRLRTGGHLEIELGAD